MQSHGDLVMRWPAWLRKPPSPAKPAPPPEPAELDFAALFKAAWARYHPKRPTPAETEKAERARRAEQQRLAIVWLADVLARGDGVYMPGADAPDPARPTLPGYGRFVSVQEMLRGADPWRDQR
jgi:hypothetical protein